MSNDLQSVPDDITLSPVVIVAAHPDDEVAGLGARLQEFQELRAIIHVTDGAPRSGPDIQNAGTFTWWEYAQLRRTEFEEAMHTAYLSAARRICLWCPDQQASFRMSEHALSLASLFKMLHPTSVFTHPYEGGHPDHDATSASVHFAVTLLETNRQPAPKIFEFASYHAGYGDGMETECFLEHADRPVQTRVLTEEQKTAKRTLFECYKSQQPTLANFPIHQEPIRVAPHYDFTKPPHPGTLFYEKFPWGINGMEWRSQAQQALEKLGLARQAVGKTG